MTLLTDLWSWQTGGKYCGRASAVTRLSCWSHILNTVLEHCIGTHEKWRQNSVLKELILSCRALTTNIVETNRRQVKQMTAAIGNFELWLSCQWDKILEVHIEKKPRKTNEFCRKNNSGGFHCSSLLSKTPMINWGLQKCLIFTSNGIEERNPYHA